QKLRIKICITGCRAKGSLSLLEKFREEIKNRNLTSRVDVIPTGCQKFCSGAPIITIDPAGLIYQKVSLKDVPLILRETVKTSSPPTYTSPSRGEDWGGGDFLRLQTNKVTKNCGNINPLSIEEYIWQDGFSALGKALSEMEPEAVIAEVKNSNLRGRGGAGFPTGRKWELTRKNPGYPKYLICNGYESSPGAFMDRTMLEGDPYRIIEGMLLASYAIGASHGYIYVKAESSIAVEHLRWAINQCGKTGLLGENILGKFSFNLEVRENPSAFVCGEETALIASLEGRIGQPRPRPPFPAQSGLWGKPTCINNVETFANVSLIILEGSGSFARLGTERSGGTKIFSLGGKVKNTGLVETPVGASLGKIVLEIGGGALAYRRIKAVQTGGPSGGCIPIEKFNTPVDYETLAGLGSIMGSGGMVVLDDKSCMVELARYSLDFVQKESCGKCVPCRIGAKRMLEILTKITEGRAEPADLENLKNLALMIKESSLCGLGQTAANPVLTTLNYFQNEYEHHVLEHYCPAGQCPKLVSAPCENSCPGKIDVSGYIQAIRENDFLGAYKIICKSIPFPSVCGLVCYHPCENMCRRAEIDQPVAIRELKKFVSTFTSKRGYSLKQTLTFKPRLQKKVAIVGSGPAGLTCAWQLSQEGVDCTIFEKEKELGGMLKYGIPEYRLPRKILEKEIKDILNPRIRVHFQKSVGQNLKIEFLKQNFDAVFLGIGAWFPQELDLPGKDLKGVYQGLDFLFAHNEGKKMPVGRRVGVMGGGNVAIDVARVALRLGAGEVFILYRRSEGLLPADPCEIAAAQKEGVKFLYLVNPKRIEDDAAGRIKGVVLQKMILHEEYGPDGRKRVKELSGSESFFPLDTLVLAIGQKTNLKELLPELKVAPYTLSTNAEKIFVGGDCYRGPSSVIEAIGDGKKAASSIIKFLRGERPEPLLFSRKETSEEEYLKKETPLNIGRQRPRTLELKKRRKSFAEVESAFSKKQALCETKRCLQCHLEK
ncbi:MAG: NADH-ubiquinone oxidoreductase-F iron-sulfur binding region domain-containing protein, partial [Candidatus Omnitrophota bacterium]